MPPVLFAHRGGGRGRRENTISAFEEAVRAGATGIETDVRMTADGVPVLIHDASIRRFGVLTRPIADLRRSDLPARIPALEDLYSACGHGLPLSIDVKDPASFAPVIATALSFGGADALKRLYVCDGALERLADWKAAEPRARFCRSADGPASGSNDAVAEFRAIADAGAGAVNYRARNWNPELIDAAHDAGLQAFAWDANRKGALARVIRAGIDAIYADDVRWMVAAVRGLGDLE